VDAEVARHGDAMPDSWAGPSEADPTYRLIVVCNELAMAVDDEIARVHAYIQEKCALRTTVSFPDPQWGPILCSHPILNALLQMHCLGTCPALAPRFRHTQESAIDPCSTADTCAESNVLPHPLVQCS
jgi:hypothetical protein